MNLLFLKRPSLKRVPLKQLCALVFAVALASCASINQGASQGANQVGTPMANSATAPNIVFILVDDLGWADVGYHGSEISTPNIDALAASGVTLERSYVFPICSPTRAALMTGRNPLQYGLDGPMSDAEVLPLDLELLPQMLGEAGYQTWLIGKWHLGARSPQAMPNARGFDHYYGLLGGFHDFYTHVQRGGLDWQRNGTSVREEGHTTDLLTREALAKIETRDRTAPFFLYLAYNAPHTPLQTITGSPYDYPEIADRDRRVYAQMVSDLDEKIGTVVARLKSENLLENTLIVFVSDNGGAAVLGSNNAPLREGKGTAFEGGMRTPALVSWASHLTPGTVVEQPMFIHNWTPTLLTIAGISYDPARFDGTNAWPVFNGEAAQPQTVVMGAVRSLAAYEWPYKYIEHTPRGENQMQSFLFNVVDDPLETQNLAAANPAIVQRLSAQIARYSGIRSLAETGPRPEGLFAGEDGLPNHNLRTPETEEPWVERAIPE